MKTFVMPLISSAVMGGVIYFLNLVLCGDGFSRVKIILTVIVGAVVYFVVMLLTKSVSSEELSRIPGGRRLVKIFSRFHLID